MNVAEFTYLLSKPDAINENQTQDLSKILDEFPYFQSARSIYLKGLFKQDSFKYNSALKTTAAHTTDRTVLFNFITSEEFISIQKEINKVNDEQIKPIEVEEKEITIEKTEKKSESTINKLEQSVLESIEIATANTRDNIINEEKQEKPESILEKSILQSIKEALPEELEVTDNELMEMKEKISWLEDTVEVEEVQPTPVTFSKNETHSFQEWLQLSKAKPIEREETAEETSNVIETNSTTDKKEEKSEKSNSKMDLIDRFIESNPKIPAPKDNLPLPGYLTKKEETPYLMTETLAKIYLEQKKYSKAIQAYEILILKYPEKSSLFANRILDIKELQQNNK
ncbi:MULTISPECIES: tetratricopeptide repeat protein [Flavobacterium]|uniref:Tetratricopeptide repeat protein n=1 Tax=Flavobacterium hankyongi TaxID=1176532 RepID=A0ABP8ZUG2_9FLAO|nr:tetratricopeptide repeat protein [Flavobacterium sp. N1846]